MIKFRIDPERLTWGDMITLEDTKTATFRERRDLLAKHMVNDADEFIDPKEAVKILSKLSLPQMTDTAKQFGDKLRELMNDQLPPENGSD